MFDVKKFREIYIKRMCEYLKISMPDNPDYDNPSTMMNCPHVIEQLAKEIWDDGFQLGVKEGKIAMYRELTEDNNK